MKLALLSIFVVIAFWFGSCGPNPNPGPTPTPTPTPQPHAVIIEKELMITDLAVVNSTDATTPTGDFAIQTLLSNMAPQGKTAKDMMLGVLRSWETSQTINSFGVPARPDIRSKIINKWKAKDGQAGSTDDAWTMNFANAPFRLLAIVNRIDLHRIVAGAVKNAGEGRFVFGVLDPQTGDTTQFTVIFEYEQKATNHTELKGWADDWHHLGTFASFDANYISALKAITVKFAGSNAMPGKPNGSALNQLRTNEIAIGNPWELREFHISASSGLLEPGETMQNPHVTFNNQARLSDYINQNLADIKAGNHEVPQFFPAGQPFRGGASPVSISSWDAPNVNDGDAKFKFSIATCNACHSGETGTGFTHVSTRPQGTPSSLSGFLTGITVTDPRDHVTQRTFNDLRDRAVILSFLVGETATSFALDEIMKNRAKRVH